ASELPVRTRQASSSVSALRASMTSLHPRAASSFASASPNPRDAPVIIAVLLLFHDIVLSPFDVLILCKTIAGGYSRTSGRGMDFGQERGTGGRLYDGTGRIDRNCTGSRSVGCAAAYGGQPADDPGGAFSAPRGIALPNVPMLIRAIAALNVLQVPPR